MGNFHTFGDNFLAKPAFVGASTSGTQSGVAVDTLGYRRAALLIHVTTTTTSTFQFTVQDSANSGFSGSPATVSGATLGTALAASNANVVYVVNVDLAKRQRYLRIRVTGTGTDAVIGAVWVLGQGELAAPTQDQTALSV